VAEKLDWKGDFLTHGIGGWMGPTAAVDGLPGIKPLLPSRLVHSPVTILTELTLQRKMLFWTPIQFDYNAEHCQAMSCGGMRQADGLNGEDSER
jgi:hypothetical protein